MGVDYSSGVVSNNWSRQFYRHFNKIINLHRLICCLVFLISTISFTYIDCLKLQLWSTTILRFYSVPVLRLPPELKTTKKRWVGDSCLFMKWLASIIGNNPCNGFFNQVDFVLPTEALTEDNFDCISSAVVGWNDGILATLEAIAYPVVHRGFQYVSVELGLSNFSKWWQKAAVESEE